MGSAALIAALNEILKYGPEVWYALKIVALSTAIWAAFELLFDPVNGGDRVGNFLGNIIRGVFKVASPVLGQLETALADVTKSFLDSITAHGPGVANQITGPAGILASQTFTDAATALSAFGLSTPDTASAVAQAAISNAFGNGMASHAVSVAYEAVFPEKLNTLNAFGPLLGQMAGFAEVAEKARGALYENAFGKGLQYHYQQQFKPEYPDESDAVLWHSRRLLTDDDLKVIFDYSGLKAEYETPFVTSAYRAVSPFILARAAATGAISDTDLRDVLNFGGYRDVDITRLLAAFSAAAVLPYQTGALHAFIAAAAAGLYADTQIDDEMNSLGVTAANQPFVKKEIAYKVLERTAAMYEKSISEGYRYGTILDADYVNDLAAIGVSTVYADARYAVDSIAKAGRATVSAANAAARLTAAQVKANVHTASEQYLTGTTDALTLTAQLALSGLDPKIAAFLIQYLTARYQASLAFAFGVTDTRDKISLLREKVAAVAQQVEKAGLGESAALGTLASLGIDADNSQALVSAWLAHGQKIIIPI